jgi:hypothetical protein
MVWKSRSLVIVVSCLGGEDVLGPMRAREESAAAEALFWKSRGLYFVVSGLGVEGGLGPMGAREESAAAEAL